MSQRRNVIMSEGSDAMPYRRVRSLLMGGWGMLESLPGMLVSGQVLLFAMLLRDAMGVRRAVLQFGASLVVLIM